MPVFRKKGKKALQIIYKRFFVLFLHKICKTELIINDSLLSASLRYLESSCGIPQGSVLFLLSFYFHPAVRRNSLRTKLNDKNFCLFHISQMTLKIF